ncbi:extracellular catalytic domain type 1 short-chain-length polyhydroxyalkanoate depolymerase [Actinophytocola oryzae]|uniref:Poly(Hydroxyalkanoate) depolymerase family esterase n=1 Tax=Actinophytocola oryzae TaxID=502181 RepID=A0A4R7W4M2_9PSEU|nr:PHB depolymerase family esterase [Actinophytocola oryzae]TDV56587.1 poly(hydroxyalkanoate) depolymerase family esterase [Actinophytocola oryzae]
MTRTAAVFVTIASTLALVAADVPLRQVASAAALVEVTDFGDNPGNLRMHLYVPDSVRPEPAVVVAMHGCTGSGPGYYQSSEFASLADRYGFVVVYPSASEHDNCFDVWSDAARSRDGGSDPDSIVSMVDYVRARHHADPRRVFATGGSSGGMETTALLVLHPDVFAAGAAFMGIPFACFPNEADFDPSRPCFTGTVDKSPREWGDLARATNPDHAGPWPRVQLWHGTDDTLIAYSLLREQVDQWTDLHGLSPSPTATDSPAPGWTREHFGYDCGAGKVEAITVAGGVHNLPTGGMAAHAVEFFGLTTG